MITMESRQTLSLELDIFKSQSIITVRLYFEPLLHRIFNVIFVSEETEPPHD